GWRWRGGGGGGPGKRGGGDWTVPFGETTMIVTRPGSILACAIGLLISTAAGAFDNGQWNDVPDHVRSWFKSLRSPAGLLCCGVADGHRTAWEIRREGYFIPNPIDPPRESFH